jgi:hypothetical protein
MITQKSPSIPVHNTNATLLVQISNQDLNNILLSSGMGAKPPNEQVPIGKKDSGRTK